MHYTGLISMVQTTGWPLVVEILEMSWDAHNIHLSQFLFSFELKFEYCFVHLFSSFSSHEHFYLK